MVIARLFVSFILGIINITRTIIFFAMKLLSFIVNIIGLAGIVIGIIAIRNWIVNGWSNDIKQMLICSLLAFGGAFIYYLIMYLVNPNKQS